MKESREFSAWGVRAQPKQASWHTEPHGFGPPDFGSPSSDQGYPAGHYAPPYPDQGMGYHGSGPNLRRPAHATGQTYAHNTRPVSDNFPPRSRGMQTKAVLHGLGAVLSLALMIGTAAWVWQLMQRDVAGVPVVRALEGPLRVAPENPGGRQAAHQGLSVNELAASTDAIATGDIVLAPPSPELAEDDIVPTQDAPIPPVRDIISDEMQPIQVALQQALEASEPRAEPLGVVSATRRAVLSSPRPPSRNSDVIAQARTAAVSSPTPTNNSASGDDLAASVAMSVAAGMGNVRDIDVDPASLGPGTRLVQLGAYDDATSARAAWDQLARRFSPLLDDRGRVIEAAQSGGSVFYRLRAHGFEDERDARRFCSALVDQQIDCIPVLIR
ncbi:SPOR domain-containing protein [Roseinatronobacter sp.]|uniref:SPOR domain-containing protein n=1 Tax=Roseinatronobacter sp. TaxID=1945755 RepID=UPI0025D22706|nr:SPOR domain-containing protein [Rhodobaca sp.]